MNPTEQPYPPGWEPGHPWRDQGEDARDLGRWFRSEVRKGREHIECFPNSVIDLGYAKNSINEAPTVHLKKGTHVNLNGSTLSYGSSLNDATFGAGINLYAGCVIENGIIATNVDPQIQLVPVQLSFLEGYNGVQRCWFKRMQVVGTTQTMQIWDSRVSWMPWIVADETTLFGGAWILCNGNSGGYNECAGVIEFNRGHIYGHAARSKYFVGGEAIGDRLLGVAGRGGRIYVRDTPIEVYGSPAPDKNGVYPQGRKQLAAVYTPPQTSGDDSVSGSANAVVELDNCDLRVIPGPASKRPGAQHWDVIGGVGQVRLRKCTGSNSDLSLRIDPKDPKATNIEWSK